MSLKCYFFLLSLDSAGARKYVLPEVSSKIHYVGNKLFHPDSLKFTNSLADASSCASPLGPLFYAKLC